MLRWQCAPLLVLAGCVEARPAPTPLPLMPPLYSYGQRVVEVTGQRLAYNQVLRALVASGMRITFADADAGVLTAERTDVDRETMALSSVERENIWNSFTDDQKLLAIRSGRSNRMRGLAIFRRRLSISVTVTETAAVLTHGVVVCVQPPEDLERCGGASPMLREEEILIAKHAADAARFADGDAVPRIAPQRGLK